jgi:hypothetical protein
MPVKLTGAKTSIAQRIICASSSLSRSSCLLAKRWMVAADAIVVVYLLSLTPIDRVIHLTRGQETRRYCWERHRQKN